MGHITVEPALSFLHPPPPPKKKGGGGDGGDIMVFGKGLHEKLKEKESEKKRS